MGHPLSALAWLANELVSAEVSTESSQYGGGAVIGLRKGDFVMSGAICLLHVDELQPGDLVVAEFAGMGSVELQITEAPQTTTEEASAAPERPSMSEWQQLRDDARARGIKLPQIYPWSAARESDLRELLSATAGAGDPVAASDLMIELREVRTKGELAKRARATGVEEGLLDEAESKEDVIQLILRSNGLPATIRPKL